MRIRFILLSTPEILNADIGIKILAWFTNMILIASRFLMLQLR